jgi:ActR/RegA family two-component response regulator
MSIDAFAQQLTERHRTILKAIYGQATTLLDHTPRFKYFTLHGTQHLSNLFEIASLLNTAGIRLQEEEAFLLGCAICTHDLGMVVPLADKDATEILLGKPQTSDPAVLETEIRNTHHELIGGWVERHFDFLSSLGLSPSEAAVIRDIGRGHRKTDLQLATGYAKHLGALLRVVDELDIGPSRAPSAVLMREYEQMDSTACWHWFKHNITENWRLRHNVVAGGDPAKILFRLAVHPPSLSSVPYWLHQARRPILKVMQDEGASRIIQESWLVNVTLESAPDLSTPIAFGEPWHAIENKALSAGRKVVMVIDDESRKMEDLLLPLMQKFHVVFASNAKDAIDKLGAQAVDLAIVDLQIGSGYMWTPAETMDFKMTGLKLVEEITKNYPGMKVGILTGSRHDLSQVADNADLEFLLRKPISAELLEKAVERVLA